MKVNVFDIYFHSFSSLILENVINNKTWVILPSHTEPEAVLIRTTLPTWLVAACMKWALLYTPSGTTALLLILLLWVLQNMIIWNVLIEKSWVLNFDWEFNLYNDIQIFMWNFYKTFKNICWKSHLFYFLYISISFTEIKRHVEEFPVVFCFQCFILTLQGRHDFSFCCSYHRYRNGRYLYFS